MKPPHQHSRIDLAELKTQIAKKLGPEGSKQYFYYLQGFLSLKMSKPEFNKLCLRILGHENIPLHNHFIRSILRNACSAKAPPPPPPANHHQQTNDVSKQVVNGKEISSDGNKQNGSHILPGDMRILPVSPRKARTAGLRDRRGGERRSALRLNGKVTPVPLQPHDDSTRSGSYNVLENGHSKLNTSDKNTVIARPHVVQHHQVVQRGESEGTAPTPVYIKDLAEPVTRNDENRDAFAVRRSSPIPAPMGVPLCSASVGGTCRDVSGGHTLLGPFCDDALLDSRVLRKRMEGIAACQGLEGVSVDCANVLNHGLDSYLKGLIKSSIGIVGARSGNELTKDNSPVNGFKMGHQHQLQISEQKSGRPISLQDFRVVMELNPRQLGEDWPLLLEKICTHVFEE